MEKSLEPIVKVLQEKFGATFEEFRGEVQCMVKPEHIIEALTTLRDAHHFELLSMLSAIDYFPQTSPRFHVIYQLNSLEKNLTLQLRVPVEGESPKLPTSTGVFKTGLWREREVFDMFGIEFEAHPDPRRILNPDEIEGHPLRRDFPLGYEEPQFSFNYEEIDLGKPYAKE